MLPKFLPALALAASLLAPWAAQAQTEPARPCDFDNQQAQYFATHPGEEARYRALLHSVATMSPQQRAALSAAPDVTIPVVMHVLYLSPQGSTNLPANNTTDAQIRATIELLNTDYSKQNADTAQVIPLFAPLIANVGFKFKLAKIDPNGNCTTGITRHYNVEASYGTAGAASIVYWDATRYLNVWLVDDIASGAGGYTFGQLCPGAGGIDGIVIRKSQFGVNNVCANNLCVRSMTHEIGHFFGLPHTWGRSNTPGLASNCSIDDGIADTPNTAGYPPALGNRCDTNYGTCTDANGQRIISNVQNYMDYSDCLSMFTLGQKAVMRGLLTSPAFTCRATLVSPANLVATGTNDGYVPAVCAPIVAFNPTQTNICEGASVSFRDYSYNLAAGGGTITYAWTFPGGSPATATGSIATTSYATAGLYDVTLTVTNSAGSRSTTTTNLIQVNGPSAGLTGPATESFEAPSFFTSFPAPSQRNFVTSGNAPTGATNKPGFPTASAAWFQRRTLPAADGTSYLTVANQLPRAVGVLTTPNIDLGSIQGVPFVEFSRYFAPRPGTNNDETLNVAASTDCGTTFTSIANFTGPQLYTTTVALSGSVPNSAADWQPLLISLPNYRGARRLQLRFTMTNGAVAGNTFFFDALRVNELLATRASFADRGISLAPNPLTNETTLRLSLPASTQVAVQIIDVLGRPVLAMPAKPYAAGEQTIALPTAANALPGGLYMVRVSLNGQTYSSKLTVR